MMSQIDNIIYQLVDSAADSKLKTLKPGEKFGEEKPGGEARLYIGQITNENEFDEFFGFNENDTVRFKVFKIDLLDYLTSAKDEFFNPSVSYRLKISDYYLTLVSHTINLEDSFEIEFRKNIDKQRYYISPVNKDGNTYSKNVRNICLPLLTQYNFLRTKNEDGQIEYYFKPIFIIPSSKKFGKTILSNRNSTLDISYLRAIRTKPFLLLAGISGTGKSRIVKQMAFDSCPKIPELRKDPTSPGNYCLIEVKPNWHDSTELLGYESKIGGDHYVLKPFVKFLAKAMLYPEVPFFVCLDEMNLAPVEQYFAEFLSVLESRTKIDGHIVSEPLIKNSIFSNSKYASDLKHDIFNIGIRERKDGGITIYDSELTPKEEEVYSELSKNGLRIPENVIIVGTVNMDETTHQFSRKVIDRAMTIEMNLPEGNPFMDFFEKNSELEYKDEWADASFYLPTEVKASDAIKNISEVRPEIIDDLKQNVSTFLTSLNKALDGTPFKVAYRAQNELVLYFYQLWLENQEEDWNKLLQIAEDQILMMKVLPRIEGDEELLEEPIAKLKEFCLSYSNASKKVEEMSSRLEKSRFTSFWP